MDQRGKNCDEITTELTCEEAEMICAMAVATQVKSTVNENYALKMKFTLESRSGKLSEICAGVLTRTKYEMKSVIYKWQLKNQNPCLKVASEIEICN